MTKSAILHYLFNIDDLLRIHILLHLFYAVMYKAPESILC